MKIYEIKESDDMEGRSFSVRGYVSESSEKNARKKANENGIQIEENCGYYQIRKGEMH